MLPSNHALATAIVAVPLWRRGWSLAAIAGLFAGGVLIDVDHYLSYVWHTGDVSIRRAYRFHRNGAHANFDWRLHPRWPTLGIQQYREFHSFGAIAAVAAASMMFGRGAPFLRAVALGMAIHRFLDELTGWAFPPAPKRDGET